MTPSEAEKAVQYLTHAFGGYPPSDMEKRAYTRLFVSFPVAEIREAIDRLVRAGLVRRPSPADVASTVKTMRREAELAEPTVTVLDDEKDITSDPDEISNRVATLRAQLRGEA